MAEQKPTFKKLSGSPADNQPEQIEEAEVEDIKPSDPSSLPSGNPLRQRRRGWRHYLPILILGGIIFIVLVVVLSLNSSDKLTEQSKPEQTATQPEQLPITPKKDKKTHKQKTAKQQKNKKTPGEVILLPSNKNKQKNKNDDNAHQNNPTTEQPSDNNNPPDGFEVTGSPIVQKAIKELKQNPPPNRLRYSEKEFAQYLQRKLDYPVVTYIATHKTGVLGILIIEPLGDVILTNKQPNTIKPSIERITVWSENYQHYK